MKVSSVALLFLVPMFVFTFGGALGGTYEEVTAYFARPFPAIVAALTLIIGFKHFNQGFQVLIEDYVHGIWEKILIIGMTCISYGAAATGVFAIAKLAL
jgi:succinate dehydrogenase / fumarate reductase membrane anchor subunit